MLISDGVSILSSPDVWLKCFVCSWFTVFPMSLLIIKWHVLPFARVCLYKVCSICKVWLLNTMGRLLFVVVFFFIDVLVTRVCCAIWFELEFASAPRLRHRSQQRHIKYRSLKGLILIRLLCCIVHVVLNILHAVFYVVFLCYVIHLVFFLNMMCYISTIIVQFILFKNVYIWNTCRYNKSFTY